MYFTVFTSNSFTPINVSTVERLFSGRGNGDNQYEDDFISQQEYLKVIAYHMACLNTRMNDLRSLLNEINTYYTGVLQSFQEELNSAGLHGSTEQVNQAVLALQASADEAQTYLNQADFRKGVMDYNSEKNRYANILLGLYAFLNISALAVIFHIMKS
jgi:hypothetical protein